MIVARQVPGPQDAGVGRAGRPAPHRASAQRDRYFWSLMLPRVVMTPFSCWNRLITCEVASSSPDWSNFTWVVMPL